MDTWFSFLQIVNRAEQRVLPYGTVHLTGNDCAGLSTVKPGRNHVYSQLKQLCFPSVEYISFTP